MSTCGNDIGRSFGPFDEIATMFTVTRFNSLFFFRLKVESELHRVTVEKILEDFFDHLTKL